MKGASCVIEGGKPILTFPPRLASARLDLPDPDFAPQQHPCLSYRLSLPDIKPKSAKLPTANDKRQNDYTLTHPRNHRGDRLQRKS